MEPFRTVNRYRRSCRTPTAVAGSWYADASRFIARPSVMRGPFPQLRHRVPNQTRKRSYDSLVTTHRGKGARFGAFGPAKFAERRTQRTPETAEAVSARQMLHVSALNTPGLFLIFRGSRHISGSPLPSFTGSCARCGVLKQRVAYSSVRCRVSLVRGTSGSRGKGRQNPICHVFVHRRGPTNRKI